MPNLGQILLLCTSIALFAIAGLISLARQWRDTRYSRVAAKAIAYTAILVALGVLIWHAIDRRRWLPLDDNFDAFIWLALLLAAFVMYVQRRRPIGGLDWFVMPIVLLLLTAAAVFGRARPHEYVPGAWSWVHRLTAYGGAVAFAVAAAVGAMYLVVNRRLRQKSNPAASVRMGNLERLEHVTLQAVTLGFALLTVGAITGFVQVLFNHKDTPLAKVVLTAFVWLVYAIVLHSPINPRLRGRKSAILSILGFVLMIGTLVAVQFMPESAR
jgi:ABC-type uncharacterized transport system permease subunit